MKDAFFYRSFSITAKSAGAKFQINFGVYTITDYTQSATIMQLKFRNEWNHLLGTFNQVLFAIPENENLHIFILLINKINSNCRAAINLIEQGFINEGLMIFRSAIETVIYAKYLKLYPEEKEAFLYLSDFFLIKNQFIYYKKQKNNTAHISSAIQISLQNIENNIRQLFKTNKLLRDEFPVSAPRFDENGIKKLDKFFHKFSQKHKFPSQKVHDLLGKIKKKEAKFANTHFDLHDIYYEYYDKNSAILHGNEKYWNDQPHLDEYHLFIVTSQLLRILVIATDLIQDHIPEDVYNHFNQAIQRLTKLEQTTLSPSFSPIQNSPDPRINS